MTEVTPNYSEEPVSFTITVSPEVASAIRSLSGMGSRDLSGGSYNANWPALSLIQESGLTDDLGTAGVQFYPVYKKDNT